jgi:hypothetical protein
MGTDVEIESLVRTFEAGTLPKPEWTHRAHLTVALWYLRRHPRAEATRRIRDGIKSYNARHGNAAGYHETITLAWVALVDRFLDEHDHGQPLSTLAGSLLVAIGDKDHLLAYYSEKALKSEEARRGWVPPDLRPFASKAPIESGRGPASGGLEDPEVPDRLDALDERQPPVDPPPRRGRSEVGRANPDSTVGDGDSGPGLRCPP